jgi:hypothetical protein
MASGFLFLSGRPRSLWPALVLGGLAVGGILFADRCDCAALHDKPCPHDGEVVEDYPNGMRYRVHQCVQGKVEGPETTWFDNGTKRWEGRYVAGQRDGTWTFWNRDGQLNRSENWRAGVLQERLQ